MNTSVSTPNTFYYLPLMASAVLIHKYTYL